MDTETPRDTDTNSPEVRLNRAIKQIQLEKDLKQKTSGTSLTERHSHIRDVLFGEYGHIAQGQHPTQLIRDRAIPEYPKPLVLAEKIVPNIYKFIDEQQARISHLPPQEQDVQGFRLAILEYLLTITAHQDADGNGQTNRLVALSYIREFCPRWDNHFLPTKYTDEWEKDEAIKAFSPLLFTDSSAVIPIDIEPTDYDTFQQIRSEYIQARDRIDTELKTADGNNQPYDIIGREKQLAEEIMTRLIAQGVPLDPNQIRQTYPNLTPYSIYDAITTMLSHKYPDGYFGWLGHNRAAAKTNLLKILITRPEGQHVLQQYLEQGSEFIFNYQPETDPHNQIKPSYEKTSLALTFLENEFARLLTQETQDRHLAKFQKATQNPIQG
jgi:hypothetical protein